MNIISVSTRSTWLDNAKMVAMLCVIAGHTGGLLANGLPGRIMGIIVAFNMPLFVLLSGYTTLSGLLRLDSCIGLMEYAEKTLWRMVLPAVTLSAIDQAWRGLIFSQKLWMLYAAMSLALWLIGKAKEKNVYKKHAIALNVGQAFDKILQMKQWIAIGLFVFGCVLCRLFTIDYGFYTSGIKEMIAQELYHIYPLRVIVAIMISLAVIRWVYEWSHSYNWFSKMGSYTMAFYTIHALMLDDFIKPYVHFDNPSNYMWVFGLLATATLTALSYFIIRMCEGWVVTRRLVLGILK